MRRTNFKNYLAVSVLLMSVLCPTASARTIYVDCNAPGPNHNGISWENAYLYLQDALSVATIGDEIWVAQGTYKPDRGTGITLAGRGNTFQLVNGVALRGGYAGYGEPDPNMQNIGAYETVLSGDLDGDDDGFTNNEENSYHVVSSIGTDVNAVLDGFIVRGGNANGSWPDSLGGGIYNGWGFYNGGSTFIFGGSPTLINCVFLENVAEYGGGMFNSGGWIFNDYDSSPRLTNCVFSGNLGSGYIGSGNLGGGMYNEGSSPVVTNCRFTDNLGGGMCNTLNSNPVLTNCTFSGNSAVDGAGMSNFGHGRPILVPHFINNTTM